ncbi:MAG TPA: ATP-binding protein, partial [Desulfomonilaceae bacterium]|nr:ATP-binding protein [Desulfomonilaceae bacterium]
QALREADRAESVLSAVSVPLAGADGPFGLFNIASQKANAFSEADAELLSQIGTQISLVLDKALAYDRLQISRDGLQRSEAYLAEAQRLSHTGSWALHVASGKYDYWSEETFLIYEFDPQEGLPTREAVYRRIHPEDRNREEESFQKSICEKDDTLDEFRIVLPSGTAKHVQVIRHPVLNEVGDVVKLVGTTMDITDRKRAEEALEKVLADLEVRVEKRTKELSEANQSLEAANKELESFSYSVSHDLLAPLRRIEGFSQILLEDYGPHLDEEAVSLLGSVRSNTAKMGQLIEDLLALSRLGRTAMQVRPLEMSNLACQISEELKSMNPDRTLRISINDMPSASGDEILLRQVFINLIGNAIKFTREKDIGVIDVCGYESGNEKIYSIKDNGAGFDMAYYHKLFGVFQRLHSADEFEGTGVGLAIVHRIISRHGGRVWAEGEIGKGAIFYFSLPNRER